MRSTIILSYAWLLELYRKPLMLSHTLMKLLYVPGLNKLRTFNAKARAFAEFVKARQTVPAYRSFLQSKGFAWPSFTGFVPNIHEIPCTDKENYVKIFSIDDRCVEGKVPNEGIVIDESSGSSGSATNWARGKKERARNAQFIQFGMQQLLGTEPLFIINAFAMGPWATGVNVTMSCVPFSRLKSLGPDKLKIENTIKQFGKYQKYVIMGYPPFLKLLVDNSDIDWASHNISFIFGGESMSEGMRDYLFTKGIKKVYSSFGASDIELNISAENDFTISLRRLLRSNTDLSAHLLKYHGALPMIFQYNPTDFFIETSPEGELIITVARPDYIAPKIRYNLHDKGHVMTLETLYKVLEKTGADTSTLLKPLCDLPLLFHYGRADMTVSFFGANISPNDIQETLYNLPDLAAQVHSFCIQTNEDKEGTKQLVVFFELQANKCPSDIPMEQTNLDFFDQLTKTNQDFREAKKMVHNPEQMGLQFFPYGTGLFAENDMRIKARYIVR